MKEQRRLGKMIIRDRIFKVGDVIRWIPLYASYDEQADRGLGVVIESKGGRGKSYWTGDKKIREFNMILERSNYVHQDYAPIPQVAEAIEIARELGGIVEGDNYLEQVI